MELIADLAKLHEEECLIHARAVLEQPDRANEIIDYDAAKLEFQSWSDEVHRASQGKSRGNVRVMHQKQVAGRVVDITFDDTLRAIDVAIKVDDPLVWTMCKSGAYTGLSIGGRYGRKWKDPSNDKLTRYAPVLSELSIVDRPCMPGATFQVLKADGATEARPFMPEVGNRIEFLEGVQWGGGTRFGTVVDVRSGCVFVRHESGDDTVPQSASTDESGVEGFGWSQLSRDHIIDHQNGLWRISPHVRHDTDMDTSGAMATIGKDDSPKSFGDLYKAAGKDGRAGRDGDGDGIINEGKDNEGPAPGADTKSVQGHRERRDTDEGYRAATTGVIQDERGKAIGAIGGAAAGFALGTAAGYEFFRPGSGMTEKYFRGKENVVRWVGNKAGRLVGSMGAQVAIGAESVSRKALRMTAADKSARETAAKKFTNTAGQATANAAAAGMKAWNRGAHAFFSGWDRGGVRAFGNPHALRTISGAAAVGLPAAYGASWAGEKLGSVYDSFFPRRVAKADGGDLLKWGGGGFDESKVRRDDTGRFTFKDGAMIAGGAIAGAAAGAAAGYLAGRRKSTPPKRKLPAAAAKPAATKPNAITSAISSAARNLKNYAMDTLLARRPGEKVLPTADEAIVRHASRAGGALYDVWKKTSLKTKLGLLAGAGALYTLGRGNIDSFDVDLNPLDDGFGAHVKFRRKGDAEPTTLAQVKTNLNTGSVDIKGPTDIEGGWKPRVGTSYKPGKGIELTTKTAAEQAATENRQIQTANASRDESRIAQASLMRERIRGSLQDALKNNNARLTASDRDRVSKDLFRAIQNGAYDANQFRNVAAQMEFPSLPWGRVPSSDDVLKHYNRRIESLRSGAFAYPSDESMQVDLKAANVLLSGSGSAEKVVRDLSAVAKVRPISSGFNQPASYGTPGRDGRAGRDGDGDGIRGEGKKPASASPTSILRAGTNLESRLRDDFWALEVPKNNWSVDQAAAKEQAYVDRRRASIERENASRPAGWQPTVNLDAEDTGEDIADAMRRGNILKADFGQLRKDGRAGRDGDGDGILNEGKDNEGPAGAKAPAKEAGATRGIQWKDIGTAAGAGAGWFVLDQIAAKYLRPIRTGASLATRLAYMTRRGAIGSGGSIAGGTAGEAAGSRLDTKRKNAPQSSAAEDAGKFIGNVVGQSVGTLAGVAAGTPGGPVGMFAGGLAGSSAGAVGGEQLGVYVGRALDRWTARL